MNQSFRDENPYQSPVEPIVRAELVKPPPRKETFDEVFAKMMRWGGSGLLVIVIAMAASGSQVGAGEVMVVGVGYAMYWGPRLIQAYRYRPTSRGGR